MDSRLDSYLSSVVLPEASRRSGYTYKLGEGVRTPEQQAGKVAQGLSWTMNSRHLSGRARDVLAYDAQGNYIKDGAHPAYTTLGEVANEFAPKAPVPIKWGVVRNGRQVDPGHFELDASAGAPSELDDLLGDVPAKSELDDLLSDVPTSSASGSEDYGEPVTVNASAHSLPTPPLGELPRRQTFDPATDAGRAGRDAREVAETDPHARLTLDVPLPMGKVDWSEVTSGDAARAVVREYAKRRNIPDRFVDRWLAEHGNKDNLHLYDSTTGESREPTDYIFEGSPAYDFERRTLRVSAEMPHLKQLDHDYQASRGFDDRLVDWASDETHSTGEKALDAAGAVAAPVAKGAGYVARPLTAASAGVWAATRGQNPLTEAGHVLSTGETTAAGENPVGNFLRDSQTLNNINPRLGRLLGAGADMVFDPSNLLMLGAAGKVAGVAGRMGRAAEEVGSLGRSLGLLERGIVEARPLGLAEELTGLRTAIEATPAGRVAALENRLGRVTEVARKLRAGEDLTPAESALAAEIRAKHAPKLGADFDTELVKADGGRLAHSSKTGETVDLRTGEPVNLDAEPSPAVRGEQLRYAQERAEYHARLAETATNPAARRTAQELADDYAQEAARLESGTPAEPSPEGFDVGGAAAAGIGPRPGSTPLPLWRRALSTAKDVVQLPKVRAGFDLSATGRQGLAQIAAHPTYLKEAFAEQVKAFASEGSFNSFIEGIRTRPDFDLMRKSGLYLSHVGGNVEEPFASKLVQKIPGVRASDRAYSAALDSIRTQAWDAYTSAVAKNPNVNEKTYEAIADLINVSTGRGRVPILDRYDLGRKFVNALNVPFFSPRNTASKFNLISPARVVRNVLDPATRPVAWLQMRDAVRGTAVLGTTLGLAHLAGLDVGVDPRSSDFGKLRVGQAVYSLSGGNGFTLRYLVNMGRAFQDEARGKRLKPRETPTALTLHYLRSQLQPAAASAVDVGTGKTYEGEPATYTHAALEQVLPFVVGDVWKGYQAEGAAGAVKALPGVLGVGVNFYPKKGRPRAEIDDLLFDVPDAMQ